MYRSVLAALLLGLLPVPTPSVSEQMAALDSLAIAAPRPPIEISQRLSASGVLVLDFKSGQQLYAKQSDVPRPMASLTKLMTALLIVESHDLNEWVTTPVSVGTTDGSKVYLSPGEKFTVGDLLSALLISSANDAAHTLAIYHSGSIDGFVELMNLRAEALGLKDTSFTNPAGLDGSEQLSTPRDMGWLLSFVLRYDAIRSRMGMKGARMVSHGGEVIPLLHTHLLIHQDPRIIAGKTGTTLGAKECLGSLVETSDGTYVVVLMHSSQRYDDMQIVLDSLDPPEGS
jgi:D-alanyl-D-alanine carboxypeptidase